MIVILLEAAGALLLLVLIVWWTMFSGRDRGEPRDSVSGDQPGPAAALQTLDESNKSEASGHSEKRLD